ncbi:PRKR-interacting protein 1 homolog [Amphiura filiformis]|uniref:PRKR-interacting protein 1 homolog n=1 Tax=Amphiura filiformis TaxID=82378 RepID=UPI003B20D86C
MGDESDEKQDKKKRYQPKKDQPLVLPKTAADKQRMQIEKLMRNQEKDVYIPDRPKDWKPRAPPEFVRDVMGSSAGAGSGEFHVYRGFRRREYARQMFIQGVGEVETKNEEFHKKLEENQKKADNKTAKKRAKRQKKKQKMQEKKKQKLQEEGEGDDSDSKSESEDEKDDNEDDAEENCFVIGGR